MAAIGTASTSFALRELLPQALMCCCYDCLELVRQQRFTPAKLFFNNAKPNHPFQDIFENYSVKQLLIPVTTKFPFRLVRCGPITVVKVNTDRPPNHIKNLRFQTGWPAFAVSLSGLVGAGRSCTVSLLNHARSKAGALTKRFAIKCVPKSIFS
mgnify:CR=1 FL=1